MSDDQTPATLADLTADIVSAYVTNNRLSPDELPAVIQRVHAALGSLKDGPVELPAEKQPPAVSIRKSITPDFLISLEDGRKYKALKRHLGSLGMSPADYRAKWDLPKNYPMVASNYSAQRSAMAKAIGLGAVGRGRPAAGEAAVKAPTVKAPATKASATDVPKVKARAVKVATKARVPKAPAKEKVSA
jgi:predicted transcriptional regulator